MKARASQTSTKADLVKAVYDKIGYSKKYTEGVVDAFFDIVKESLNQGKGIKINKFGKFILKDRKAKKGRNLKTGETVMVAPRRVVLFRASVHLKKLFKS